MTRILLIQHAAIGDVLMCTPAVRALKKYFPQAEITFLVGEKAYDALKFNPNIDAFIVPDYSMNLYSYILYLVRFPRYKFDIVIDFQKNPRSALISFLTFAKTRISFLGRHRNYAFNIKAIPLNTQIYAAINKLQLLRSIGIEEAHVHIPEMYVAQDDEKWGDQLWEKLKLKSDDFIVALSPVSPKVYRRWKPEYFAAATDLLISKYHAKIIFTWGPGEFNIIKSILENMKHTISINYSIENIRQLKVIFQRSRLFLGNDNGPRHIAISCDTPTIGIFSHIYAEHWTPPNNKKHLTISPVSPGIKNVNFDFAMSKIQNFIEEIIL